MHNNYSPDKPGCCTGITGVGALLGGDGQGAFGAAIQRPLQIAMVKVALKC